MLLAVTGAASLLRATPELFMVVKYAGTAYLSWVGFNLLRGALASWRRGDDNAGEPGVTDRHNRATDDRHIGASRSGL